MERSGAQVVMEALVRQGVDTLFGYPGGVVLPLYDEMLNWPQVRHVLVRHEQCAAHMADGYARATNRVGVCLATSGPGATNLVTGIATAIMDSVPMVVLTGNVNSWAIGKDAFQETDIQGITIPITKHNYLVTNVHDLPYVLEEAFFLANTGRKGPVLVDIPKDVFIAKTAIPFPERVVRRGYSLPGNPCADEIAEAVRLLQEAERPVVISGAGVVWSETSHLIRELAEKADVPIINSLLGLGTIPRDDPRSMGMMGMHGEASATIAVQNADLVIGIGNRFDDRLTGKTAGFAPKAKIVHFDIDPSEFGKSVDTFHTVTGDLAQTLAAFVAAVPRKTHEGWWKQLRAWQEEFPIVVPEDGRFLSRTVLHALNKATDGRAIVSTDVGQHQMWTAQLYRFREPKNWLSSGGLGTMGFGLPAAMGAKFARPEEEVWAVVGDGGFQMTLQELQTAVENNLNVKICLLNNGYLGMVRQWQELFYDNRYSHVAMGSPDYGKLADAYGVAFFRCSRAEDLEATFAAARAHQGPTLCEFVVEMEENVFPMVAAGATNDSLVMDPALKQFAEAKK
ncbi:biosynthetic-type acetolactate synthase large subunit [Fimbriimonas ginsengisoli]|uniref:biosynthetic-type acetolactate synthase large subunit n=1 Tax=Fimbriimonas ginsengisoli TaxID=1005039 RepID=UPI00046CD1E4|nr:biosynthetic-type acetolactate synthase large subunit [Fimbriimonas ginsengisoli]